MCFVLLGSFAESHALLYCCQIWMHYRSVPNVDSWVLRYICTCHRKSQHVLKAVLGERGAVALLYFEGGVRKQLGAGFHCPFYRNVVDNAVLAQDQLMLARIHTIALTGGVIVNATLQCSLGFEGNSFDA